MDRAAFGGDVVVDSMLRLHRFEGRDGNLSVFIIEQTAERVVDGIDKVDAKRFARGSKLGRDDAKIMEINQAFVAMVRRKIVLCQEICTNDAGFYIGYGEFVTECAIAKCDVLRDMTVAHYGCAVGGLEAVIGWAGDTLCDCRRGYSEGCTSVNEKFLSSF